MFPTPHQQELILKFISDPIPKLPKDGVTHIGLEIASDRQSKIDHYMKTGNELDDIEMHSLIDCPKYRNNLGLTVIDTRRIYSKVKFCSGQLKLA